MKRFIFWGLMTIIVAACTGGKKIVMIEASDNKAVPDDSIKYELETFDTRFETWFKLHDNPALYHSETYYATWNRQYVDAWNYNAGDPSKSDFFEPIVGYDPGVDYGFDLNHKLFYYFMYVEHVLKIPILPGGGPKTY